MSLDPKLLERQRDGAVRALNLYRRKTRGGHGTQCISLNGETMPMKPHKCICAERDRAAIAFFLEWPELAK